jgi:ribonuclease E
VLRIIQEEAMKENTAAVHAQVPVDVATFLLNEKRSDIHLVEARLKVGIMLIPNVHLETPNYTVARVRHDEANEMGELPLSYKMVEMPEQEEAPAVPGAEARPLRPQATVQGITPEGPAPMPVQMQSVPQAPSRPLETDRPSIIRKIFGWFKRTEDGEPEVPVTIPPAVQSERPADAQRLRPSSVSAGERPERPERPDRREHPRRERHERGRGEGSRDQSRQRRGDERRGEGKRGPDDRRPPRQPRDDSGQRQRPNRPDAPAREPRDAVLEPVGQRPERPERPERVESAADAQPGRSRRRRGRRDRQDRHVEQPVEASQAVAAGPSDALTQDVREVEPVADQERTTEPVSAISERLPHAAEPVAEATAPPRREPVEVFTHPIAASETVQPDRVVQEASAPASPPPATPAAVAAVSRRFDLPPEMVMIETAPEKRRTDTAVDEPSPDANQPRRPRRVATVESPAEPLVQIETRK